MCGEETQGSNHIPFGARRSSENYKEWNSVRTGIRRMQETHLRKLTGAINRMWNERNFRKPSTLVTVDDDDYKKELFNNLSLFMDHIPDEQKRTEILLRVKNEFVNVNLSNHVKEFLQREEMKEKLRKIHADYVKEIPVPKKKTKRVPVSDDED